MIKEKPLILVIEDVKKEIIKDLNNISNDNNLSYYFLEIILKEIYQEVVEKKILEIKNIKQQYMQKMDNEVKKGDK